MRMLRDDFEDGEYNRWWTSRYATDAAITVVETAGALKIELPVEGYGTAVASRYLDLRQAALALEVYDDGSAGATQTVSLTSGTYTTTFGDFNNLVAMHRQDGQLSFIRVDGGTRSVVGMVPYDPVAHRFWKIGRVGDDVIWSTSADGESYVEQARFPGIEFATYMRVMLEARRESGAPAYTAYFDNVNTNEPTAAAACPAASLVDDFDGPAIDSRWASSYQVNCSMTQEGGALTIAAAANMSNACRLGAGTPHDLRKQSIAVEISELLSASEPNIGATITVATLDGTNIGIQAYGGMLSTAAALESDYIQLDARPYDPVMHRWLRFRADDPSVVAEASPDGEVWELLGGTSGLTGLDVVDFTIDVVGNPVAATTVRLEGVNAP